jgi:hypothetical protein
VVHFLKSFQKGCTCENLSTKEKKKQKSRCHRQTSLPMSCRMAHEATSARAHDEAGVESKTPLGAREEDEERRGEVIGASIRNDTTTMARDGYTGQR